MFNKAGCEPNDLACMRALTTEEVLDASKTGAMGNDNVAMVLNGSFGPTHRSDLMPETLFDAVKNVSIVFCHFSRPSVLKLFEIQRNVRPNTPLMWTYARDETYGMTSDWISNYIKSGMVLEDMADEIKSAIESTGFNNPSPYFDTWLMRIFGNDLGSEMVSVFGCGKVGTNCHDQIARFTVATQWVRTVELYSMTHTIKLMH